MMVIAPNRIDVLILSLNLGGANWRKIDRESAAMKDEKESNLLLGTSSDAANVIRNFASACFLELTAVHWHVNELPRSLFVQADPIHLTIEALFSTDSFEF